MQETALARTTLSIDGQTFRALADLARQNERSVSGEARVAIRRYLEAAPAAGATRRLPEPARGGAA